MKAMIHKIFIVTENALVANGLRHQLEEKFFGLTAVTCFYNYKSCLRALKTGCDMVIVDPVLENKSGSEVLLSVKLICPQAQGLLYKDTAELIREMEHFLHDEAVNF